MSVLVFVNGLVIGVLGSFFVATVIYVRTDTRRKEEVRDAIGQIRKAHDEGQEFGKISAMIHELHDSVKKW